MEKAVPVYPILVLDSSQTMTRKTRQLCASDRPLHASHTDAC